MANDCVEANDDENDDVAPLDDQRSGHTTMTNEMINVSLASLAVFYSYTPRGEAGGGQQ